MILFKKLDSFLTSEFSNLCHFQIKIQSISFRQKKGFPVSWILYQLHNHNNDYQCWLGHPIGHHSFWYQKLFLNHSSKAMPIVDWNVQRIIIWDDKKIGQIWKLVWIWVKLYRYFGYCVSICTAQYTLNISQAYRNVSKILYILKRPEHFQKFNHLTNLNSHIISNFFQIKSLFVFHIFFWHTQIHIRIKILFSAETVCILCYYLLNQMILCSKLKNSLWKIVTK